MIKDMARKLRKARKNAGLSQADVAKQLDLSTEGYGHMERGTRSIGMEYFLLLPSILGVKISDLLPDSVITDYDRARAADPRLQEINEAWNDLPDFLRDGITGMVRDAKKEFGKKK